MSAREFFECALKNATFSTYFPNVKAPHRVPHKGSITMSRNVRKWECLILVILSVLGCGKVGANVAKGIASGEREAAKGVGKLEKAALSGIGKSGTPQTSKGANWAEHAKRTYDSYQSGTNSPSTTNRIQFPYSLTTVQPTSQELYLVDSSTMVYGTPNNFQGFIFYDSQGNAVGFSALNSTQHTTDYFDRYGFLIHRE